MRNTRFPVSLNEITCTITETASSTNSPPTIASTSSCLVATATEPSSAHGARQSGERERAGVAHEDRGRRRVEPEEAEPRADHGAAEDSKLAGAGHEMKLEVIGQAD